MLRHGSTVGADLPPDKAVVVDPPRRTRAAPRPGRRRAGDSPPRPPNSSRDPIGASGNPRRLRPPGRPALITPGGWTAWLAGSPGRPDAALVKAGQYSLQAWPLRTEARAKNVEAGPVPGVLRACSGRGAGDLRRRRAHPRTRCRGARAEAGPGQPFPARRVRSVLGGGGRPRPSPLGLPRRALEYLCEKMYGSHEEMFAFAERAADGASRLKAPRAPAPRRRGIPDRLRRGDSRSPTRTTPRVRSGVWTRVQALCGQLRPRRPGGRRLP